MRASIVRLPLLILLSLFLFVNDTPALAKHTPQAIDLNEFWQRVDESIAILRGLKTHPTESVAPALDDLANRWAQFDTLALADGPNPSIDIPMDASFIVAQLSQRPYDLDQLIGMFTNLQSARRISATRSFNATEIATLESILQRPEFQWSRPPSPLEEWWNDLWARINEWFNDLFGQDSVSIPIPGELVTIMASVLLGVVLLYIFRNLFSDFISEASMDEEQMTGDELLTAETALQKAKDISRAGDHRTAVRYLYLSALLTLDERGLLRFDRAKTNREYLRSVAAFPQLSAPLRDVIEVFDRVWYGFQTLDEDGFQHYIQKVDQLREQKR